MRLHAELVIRFQSKKLLTHPRHEKFMQVKCTQKNIMVKIYCLTLKQQISFDDLGYQ